MVAVRNISFIHLTTEVIVPYPQLLFILDKWRAEIWTAPREKLTN